MARPGPGPGAERLAIQRPVGLDPGRAGRLDDHGALIFVLCAFHAVNWDQEVVLCRLPVKLGGHLDLLSSGEEVRDGHTRDPGHLRQIKQAHELL